MRIDPGQRRDLDRMSGDEQRPDDVPFDGRPEQLLDQLARVPSAAPTCTPCSAASARICSSGCDGWTSVPIAVADEVDHPPPRPRLGRGRPVGRGSSIDVVPEGVGRGGHDQRLGQLHHVLDVGEGLVGLHHRELGVVARRQTLVAEHPTDLEHPVHAADDQPLEVQLEGDPQVHRHVERVVVGDERTGVRTTGLGVQDRGLDLHEAAGLQRATEAGDHGVADLEGPAGRRR